MPQAGNQYQMRPVYIIRNSASRTSYFRYFRYRLFTSINLTHKDDEG
jgi:hypothetical protein